MTSSSLEPRPDSDRSGSDTVAEIARQHPGLVKLAKVGWAAKGLVYAIVGVVAISIAVNGLDRGRSDQGDAEASQNGAVAELAESPLGATALWAVAAGLVLYVIWRLISVALPADDGMKTWLTRVGYLVSAAVYASLAWSAVTIARHGAAGSGQESEDSRVERITRDVMEWTGGRWLVGLTGVAFIVIGGAFLHRGITASFRDELEGGGVGPIAHSTLVRLGQAGWIGRGAMMLLIGWFVMRAAIMFDPDEATGLDGALREATASTLGAVLALVVAVGLVLYGAFCIISAPRARLKGAD
jgi:hypothetical protein